VAIWRVEIFDAKSAPLAARVGYVNTVTLGQAVSLIDPHRKGGDRVIIFAVGNTVTLPLHAVTWVG
jgi:hypothetical protein